MRQSPGGSFAISSRTLRGGGAVLLQLGPGAPGATQLLDLRSTATAPLSTGSSIGLAVLRIQ
jgi:hypothetical protein